MKKNKSKKEDKSHDHEVRTRYREYRGSTSDLHDSTVSLKYAYENQNKK
jgi:hypothetical protein